MAETQMAFDVAEQQKVAAALLSSMLNLGTEPVLKAHADFLVRIESTATDFMHRRHEAVVDTQRLVASLCASSDPAGILKAQQEWVLGAFQRFTADVAACRAIATQSMNGMRGWPQQVAESAERGTPHAAEARRAVIKPLQMAAKAE